MALPGKQFTAPVLRPTGISAPPRLYVPARPVRRRHGAPPTRPFAPPAQSAKLGLVAAISETPPILPSPSEFRRHTFGASSDPPRAPKTDPGIMTRSAPGSRSEPAFISRSPQKKEGSTYEPIKKVVELGRPRNAPFLSPGRVIIPLRKLPGYSPTHSLTRPLRPSASEPSMGVEVRFPESMTMTMDERKPPRDDGVTGDNDNAPNGGGDAELQLRRSATSSSTAPARSLYRIRSQNGYGVSDEPSGESDGDGGAAAAPAPGPGADGRGASSEKDPFEVGWENGDSDPLCPRSFSKARKWLIVFIVSHVSLCVTCASSIYTSTYAKMEAEFGNSRIVSVLGLSTFVLGISFGPMFLSPLSEFYGRRPIYLVAWTTYLVWLVPQAVARNVAVVLVFRFFDGFSGSAFLAVSGGTVGDLFARHELQAPMALFSVSPFIGPSLGPLLGGFINYNVDWRWTYYVLLIWSFALWLAIVFLVPETYHPILLRNKARALRKQTGDSRWTAPSERVKKSMARAIGRSLLRPFQLLLFEPMCLNLCLFSAILLGILYLFFGAFPLVFGNNHGFNVWQTGLAFLGIMVSMLLGVATDPLWHRIRARLIRKYERETGVSGASEPEFRLPPAILGSLLAPAGLFMFGWSTYPWVHWIVPIIGSAIFGMGNVLLFTGIFTFLVDAYPLYAASALAANAFVRCLFAAAFPLFGDQMYKKLGYQWASSLLAFLTVAMLPFPYIFFRLPTADRAAQSLSRAACRLLPPARCTTTDERGEPSEHLGSASAFRCPSHDAEMAPRLVTPRHGLTNNRLGARWRRPRDSCPGLASSKQGALTCEGHGQGAEASGSGDMRCCLTCQRQQSTGAACGRVRMAHDHRQDWAAMQPRDPDGPAQRHARACACGRRYGGGGGGSSRRTDSDSGACVEGRGGAWKAWGRRSARLSVNASPYRGGGGGGGGECGLMVKMPGRRGFGGRRIKPLGAGLARTCASTSAGRQAGRARTEGGVASLPGEVRCCVAAGFCSRIEGDVLSFQCESWRPAACGSARPLPWVLALLLLVDEESARQGNARQGNVLKAEHETKRHKTTFPEQPDETGNAPAAPLQERADGRRTLASPQLSTPPPAQQATKFDARAARGPMPQDMKIDSCASPCLSVPFQARPTASGMARSLSWRRTTVINEAALGNCPRAVVDELPSIPSRSRHPGLARWSESWCCGSAPLLPRVLSRCCWRLVEDGIRCTSLLAHCGVPQRPRYRVPALRRQCSGRPGTNGLHSRRTRLPATCPPAHLTLEVLQARPLPRGGEAPRLRAGNLASIPSWDALKTPHSGDMPAERRSTSPSAHPSNGPAEQLTEALAGIGSCFPPRFHPGPIPSLPIHAPSLTQHQPPTPCLLSRTSSFASLSPLARRHRPHEIPVNLFAPLESKYFASRLRRRPWAPGTWVCVCVSACVRAGSARMPHLCATPAAQPPRAPTTTPTPTPARPLVRDARLYDAFVSAPPRPAQRPADPFARQWSMRAGTWATDPPPAGVLLVHIYVQQESRPRLLSAASRAESPLRNQHINVAASAVPTSWVRLRAASERPPPVSHAADLDAAQLTTAARVTRERHALGPSPLHWTSPALPLLRIRADIDVQEPCFGRVPDHLDGRSQRSAAPLPARLLSQAQSHARGSACLSQSARAPADRRLGAHSTSPIPKPRWTLCAKPPPPSHRTRRSSTSGLTPPPQLCATEAHAGVVSQPLGWPREPSSWSPERA
ncbi:hypothetical protein Purlil1_2339 [Purpureocillium lilacinum]|uniref:Major facilitator superfamily (MFS) profile domain-containing protein n=1 Tax=Purpureocillium lilacinum TaxID=33203 RepID=A0ABR0CA86_PURLI|nr:hypothetical protein Purlil1_2339 [Purpureocillium lilacinum]